MIENGVPDIPDGLVQLTHGVADPAAHGVIAHYPQDGLEIQARGEQQADHDVVQVQGDPLTVLGQVKEGTGWDGALRGLRAPRRGTAARLYPGPGRCRACGRVPNKSLQSGT